MSALRNSFREPIPEIEFAAGLLELAIEAHRKGKPRIAADLFRAADIKVVWDWLDSIWGKKSPYTQYRAVPEPLPHLSKEQRLLPRNPSSATKALVHERDGFYCRFCKMPVIAGHIRSRIQRAYPAAIKWGGTNATQHAAFQCMWAQYDHLVPHARGGDSSIDNVFLTCAACNYGRMDYTLEEVGIAHPDTHAMRMGPWLGLESFL
jgi:hypothetical protein